VMVKSIYCATNRQMREVQKKDRKSIRGSEKPKELSMEGYKTDRILLSTGGRNFVMKERVCVDAEHWENRAGGAKLGKRIL